MNERGRLHPNFMDLMAVMVDNDLMDTTIRVHIDYGQGSTIRYCTGTADAIFDSYCRDHFRNPWVLYDLCTVNFVDGSIDATIRRPSGNTSRYDREEEPSIG